MTMILCTLAAAIGLIFILWLGTQGELPDGEGF